MSGPTGILDGLRVTEGRPDEIRALEVLRGTVEPGRIVGSYGYDYGFGGDDSRCGTGSLEPMLGRSWALPFVAPRSQGCNLPSP
jgi:hypothetical protein